MKRDRSTERDVELDEGVANSRETGGVPNPEHPDQHTSTGTHPTKISSAGSRART